MKTSERGARRDATASARGRALSAREALEETTSRTRQRVVAYTVVEDFFQSRHIV
jgi:hypothetical protein